MAFNFPADYQPSFEKRLTKNQQQVKYQASAEEYVVGKRLGRGAFGSVYHIVDLRGGLKKISELQKYRHGLCVKVSANNSKQPELTKEIEYHEEISLKARSHPGILKLVCHAVNEIPTQQVPSQIISVPAAIMECQMCTIKDYFQFPVSVGEVYRSWLFLTGAIHFLHKHCRFIHCDIKPNNILVGFDLRPRIADFGNVVRMDRGGFIVNEKYSVAGYNHLLSGDPKVPKVDGRIDYWAAAVALATSVYGVHPFDNGDVQAYDIPYLLADKTKVRKRPFEIQELLSALLNKKSSPSSSFLDFKHRDIVVSTLKKIKRGEDFYSGTSSLTASVLSRQLYTNIAQVPAAEAFDIQLAPGAHDEIKTVSIQPRHPVNRRIAVHRDASFRINGDEEYEDNRNYPMGEQNRKRRKPAPKKRVTPAKTPVERNPASSKVSAKRPAAAALENPVPAKKVKKTAPECLTSLTPVVVLEELSEDNAAFDNYNPYPLPVATHTVVAPFVAVPTASFAASQIRAASPANDSGFEMTTQTLSPSHGEPAAETFQELVLEPAAPIVLTASQERRTLASAAAEARMQQEEFEIAERAKERQLAAAKPIQEKEMLIDLQTPPLNSRQPSQKTIGVPSPANSLSVAALLPDPLSSAPVISEATLDDVADAVTAPEPKVAADPEFKKEPEFEKEDVEEESLFPIRGSSRPTPAYSPMPSQYNFSLDNPAESLREMLQQFIGNGAVNFTGAITVNNNYYCKCKCDCKKPE